MNYLGGCRVCGQLMPTYRALTQHLRKRLDDDHQKLLHEWLAWRAEYRLTTRCRKCGSLFEVRDKALKGRKRCPTCDDLRRKLGKRQYEALTFDTKPTDPLSPKGKVPMVRRDGLTARTLRWEPGDATYQKVVHAIQAGDRINDIRQQVGVTYPVLRAIGEHAFGKEILARMMHTRKVRTIHQTLALLTLHSGLEDELVCQMEAAGIVVHARNRWRTIQVRGEPTCREADIEVKLEDGRKVLIFCDGEAFHGPRCRYRDPTACIDYDTETAQAFYDLGYSALRYSETEIRSGEAASHLLGVLDRLKASALRVCRTWHPATEHLEPQAGRTP